MSAELISRLPFSNWPGARGYGQEHDHAAKERRMIGPTRVPLLPRSQLRV